MVACVDYETMTKSLRISPYFAEGQEEVMRELSESMIEKRVESKLMDD